MQQRFVERYHKRNMTLLLLSYESQRDLLAGMSYTRGTTSVVSRAYAYDYDNIGNRESAQEAAESATAYTSNNLNLYTVIGDFEPTYDDAGNQTTVRTETGVWAVTYNAENRPTEFTSSSPDGATTIQCAYDTMGRRAFKKVTTNGTVTLHQHYIYRGYLQIACCDLTRTNHPCLWLIT